MTTTTTITVQNNQNQNNLEKKNKRNQTRNDILLLEAKESVGEIDALIPKRISELKCLLKKDKDLVPHPSSFDDFYLTFIRAKKYNLERAATLYKNYCRLRTGGCEDFLGKLIPSRLAHIVRSPFVTLLKTRDDLGRMVGIIRVEYWDLAKVDFDDMLLTIFLCLDELIRCDETQLLGVVAIVDLSTLGLEHVKKVNIWRIPTIVKMGQDAYPLRSKEVHFVNNPRVFGTMYAFAKPLLKAKLKKRILIHGSDMALLHASLHMNSDKLPQFLGGLVPDDDYADTSMVENILKKDAYYAELLKYGYVPKPVIN